MYEDITKLPTWYLRQLWDNFMEDDGINEYGFIISRDGHAVNGHDINDVHAEMNRRGEGEYVAV